MAFQMPWTRSPLMGFVLGGKPLHSPARPFSALTLGARPMLPVEYVSDGRPSELEEVKDDKAAEEEAGQSVGDMPTAKRQ
eukprot:1261329-Karenia_brevis.AAC.1